jgi:hypothetical protein
MELEVAGSGVRLSLWSQFHERAEQQTKLVQ